MEIVSVRQMKVLDANSAWFGVPVSELMENAGRAVAAEANKLGSSFTLVCGPGNNGGDGFAAARYLKSKPRIFYFWHPKGNEAYSNFFKAKNYRPTQISEKTLPELENALSESDLVIDAIFGTGVQGRMREPFRSAIALINKSGKTVLSVDVPSGMDPDTGQVEDICILPKMTVSFHAMKTGLKKNKKAGNVIIADIGIHPKAATHVGKGDFKFGYPRRKEDAHKGQAGRVLVVGGSLNYTGAPYFAAMAAMKAGCDLSYVAAPEKAAEKIACMAPDLIIHPLKSEHALSPEDVKEVMSKKFDVLCIGNGMGNKKESLEAVEQIIAGCKGKKIVIDGDGLKAVTGILGKLDENAVITPHSAEFRSLFGIPANEENVRKIASKYKFTVVLKGHLDMIAQGKNIKYCESGNPYMSKGGTGDILAGLCAGFMAQGVQPFDSACFSALVNGFAGDIAYKQDSIALIASDVLDCIGTAERILLE